MGQEEKDELLKSIFISVTKQESLILSAVREALAALSLDSLPFGELSIKFQNHKPVQSRWIASHHPHTSKHEKEFELIFANQKKLVNQGEGK